jgi:hypothetical protein
VFVGTDVSTEKFWLSARFSPEGIAVLESMFPNGSEIVVKALASNVVVEVTA